MKTEALRIALGSDGVSIHSPELFGAGDHSRVRDFLARTFSVSEVEGVELRRATGLGRIHHGAVANPSQIWRKLSRVLSASREASLVSRRAEAQRPVDADLLYLDGPADTPVRVSRIGGVLSTWRVRHQGEGSLHLSHPVLRNRRDVAFRLEEELATILGIEAFSANTLTAGVSIRYDARRTTAERIARELEQAWPRLLEGLDGPPSRKRLLAAAALTGLSYLGQYVAPQVRPFALAGVTLYAFPNVLNAAKELSRGEVGIYALYSTGLGFMLVSGMPFTASLMALFMQSWPRLARTSLVRSQRRLFASHRRRPRWARVERAGVEVEVSVDELRAGDVVVVARGELVPVDGVVEGGSAVVLAAALGRRTLEDRARGDVVSAGALVRDGRLSVRVERVGAETTASYVDTLLPQGALAGLSSSFEAERVANRNAKPALAVAAMSLLLTRTLRPSQAVIRPDYATAPRLSAQLSALRGIVHGLREGILFKSPGALDRLAGIDAIVIDDSAGLERRRVEVASVHTVEGVSADLVIGLAQAAQQGALGEQSHALAAFAAERKVEPPKVLELQRLAGVARYRDAEGCSIEIAGPSYLATSNIEPRQRFRRVLRRRRASEAGPSEESSLKPLYVLRDGAIIGAVAFTRTGELVAKRALQSLRAERSKLRVVYLSRGDKDSAQRLARAAGVDSVAAGLAPLAKAERVRDLGRMVLWLGDGSDPNVRAALAASTVSVSLAPLDRGRDDVADVHLPQGFDGLSDLLELGREHTKRLKEDYVVVYAANLIGAAAAFLSPLTTGLHTGLLSNAGTGVVYARHALALEWLAASATAAEHKASAAASVSPAGPAALASGARSAGHATNGAAH
jgi:cation transport ATPase